ncbi:MAG TPA: hypothetical protein VFH95_07935 [Candidatus Kapabacteria bacterium]|nr:hypothetical protein [Candidatus Kapabacteria bacterium]
MNSRILIGGGIALAAFAASVYTGCSTPSEPVTTPPQPVFVDTTMPPNPIDHRIYADAGVQDAIDIEWKPDTTGNTSGYILYRSTGDSTVGSDGLLKTRIILAQLESSNQLFQPLDTSFTDTTGITPGARYYYQLQAFYRSPTNTLTYSKPTHVDLSTSFLYAQRVLLQSPNGIDTLHGFPAKFLWLDPNNGGTYQIIIQRSDNGDFAWSSDEQLFGNPVAFEYPVTAPPLATGVQYQWRVRWLGATYGGSSSTWMGFTLSP